MAEKRASDLGDGMMNILREAAGAIKDEAREAAEHAKAQGAERTEGIMHAFHGAADELGRELPQAAGFIRSAADALDRASSNLRDRSVEDLLSTFSSFARRQPGAAFAGSVLAGFALSRFLKSSAPRAMDRR